MTIMSLNFDSETFISDGSQLREIIKVSYIPIKGISGTTEGS